MNGFPPALSQPQTGVTSHLRSRQKVPLSAALADREGSSSPVSNSSAHTLPQETPFSQSGVTSYHHLQYNEETPKLRVSLKHRRLLEKEKSVRFFDALRPVYKITKAHRKEAKRPSDAVYSAILRGPESEPSLRNFFDSYMGRNFMEVQAERIQQREQEPVLEGYDLDLLQRQLLPVTGEINLKGASEAEILGYLSAHAAHLDFAALNGFVEIDLTAEKTRFGGGGSRKSG